MGTPARFPHRFLVDVEYKGTLYEFELLGGVGNDRDSLRWGKRFEIHCATTEQLLGPKPWKGLEAAIREAARAKMPDAEIRLLQNVVADPLT